MKKKKEQKNKNNYTIWIKHGKLEMNIVISKNVFLDFEKFKVAAIILRDAFVGEYIKKIK